MAEIPGIIYLIVGGSITIASVFIDYKKLALFILAGIIMAIVGVIKLVKQNRVTKQHKEVHHTVAPPPTNHYRPAMVKYCPRCGTSGSIHDMYCSRCGGQLVFHRR
jgi:uncharacterized paraquat-inducible protein A